ncbi:MAG: hypothetical protein F6K40_24465 [Okeania sp. SIO3I5]|uniref:hypothetical protein n=1 Tax=Okeania sp. SIO3I5 TaxID=2607805 RepID=UPI0013B76DCA|nr:hypothetical protein [Okeania sp. SIO3I5]NEQ39232.1 hypothetical protein [Okeania sp. SIO3I5]
MGNILQLLLSTVRLKEVRSQKSEVRSYFCNGDLSNSPKIFCLKRRGFRPNYFDNLLLFLSLFSGYNNIFNLSDRFLIVISSSVHLWPNPCLPWR